MRISIGSSRLAAVVGALLVAAVLAGSARAWTCFLQEDPHRPFDRDKWTPEWGKLAPAETPRERTDRPMDVRLYDLDLTVTPDTNYVSGVVTITFTPLTEPMQTAVFDLVDRLVVSAVRVDGADAPWLHEDDPATSDVDEAQLLRIDLGRSVDPGTELVATIEYAGYPPFRSGLMGYRVAAFPGEDLIHPDPDRPLVATLSEDEGARGWWPCHDTPYDAAPVRLSVVGPEDMLLASPGRKIEETSLGDGTWRQTWWMPAPIPAYLVSLAMAKYVAWEDTVTVHRWDIAEPDAPLANTEQAEMYVEYYVDDLWREGAQFSWQNTTDMIQQYENLFGPYPYADRQYAGTTEDDVLKYGMALFVSSYAMEHPTISSMGMWTASKGVSDVTGGPDQEWVAAHELFHQWFGDALRIERWGEIWLNEGFASYAEVLWDELRYGRAAGKSRLLDKRLGDGHFVGPVLDPTPPLFGSTVYDKGAWILNMLRQVMGREDPLGPDHPLIMAMRRFVTDPQYRHARPVTSRDFQQKCEEVLRELGRDDALVNDSLDWFFVPWLTWEGRPDLRVSWVPTAAGVTLTVNQPADRSYRLPLVVRFLLESGATRTEVVWVDGPRTEAAIDLPGPVVAFEVDPDQDWLLDVSVSSIGPGVTVRLEQPRPNPFPDPLGNATALSIPFFVSSEQRVTIRVYDLRGRLVKDLVSADYETGPHVEAWDFRDDQGQRLASGTYVVRLRTGTGHEEVRRVTYVK